MDLDGHALLICITIAQGGDLNGTNFVWTFIVVYGCKVLEEGIQKVKVVRRLSYMKALFQCIRGCLSVQVHVSSAFDAPHTFPKLPSPIRSDSLKPSVSSRKVNNQGRLSHALHPARGGKVGRCPPPRAPSGGGSPSAARARHETPRNGSSSRSLQKVT
jgi:hypothetical protein